MSTRINVALAAGSDSALAAGERIFTLGGNPVDIAVGASLAAMVAEPVMASLGGQGFVMARIPNRITELIEGGYAVPGLGRSRAAMAPVWRTVNLPADPDEGPAVAIAAGPAAVAVPGALAAVATLWQRHGQIPWSELVAPARELVRAGIALDHASARRLTHRRPLLAAESASRASLYPAGNDGDDAAEAVASGARVFAPGLADALDYIAHEGARAFYEGDIAALFARAMAATGGLVTRADLAAYKPAIRPPLELGSRGFTLALNPPPALGGAAAGMLIGASESARIVAGDTSVTKLGSWALSHARVQARMLDIWSTPRLGQTWPEPLDDEATRALLVPERLHALARSLQSSNTTHISLAADDGTVIAITASMGYGAGITIPDTGIPCNNAAGVLPRDNRGEVRSTPGTRLSSNLCPTVAWNPRDGRALALGACGGARIATALAQVWLRYACDELGFEPALAMPRLHLAPSDRGLCAHCESETDARVVAAAFPTQCYEGIDRSFGTVTLAALDERGQLCAASDPRGTGVARILG